MNIEQIFYDIIDKVLLQALVSDSCTSIDLDNCSEIRQKMRERMLKEIKSSKLDNIIDKSAVTYGVGVIPDLHTKTNWLGIINKLEEV